LYFSIYISIDIYFAKYPFILLQGKQNIPSLYYRANNISLHFTTGQTTYPFTLLQGKQNIPSLYYRANKKCTVVFTSIMQINVWG
jgi:hypothetical protein